MKPSLFRLLTGLLLCLLPSLQTLAYVRDQAPLCADGQVTLTLKLGAGANDSTNTAIKALGFWNPYMKRVQLNGITAAEGVGTKGNGVNEVFFDSSVYGKAFDNGVLAITYTRYSSTSREESDVIVNSSIIWSIYSGYWQGNPGDLRRVLAHEFGHVLGLDHPDEHGQSVNALMNSQAGWTEIPQADDQTGVATLYGAPDSMIPKISYISPTSIRAYEGEGYSIYVSYSSSLPCTLVWLKDGVEMPGLGSTGNVSLSQMKPADSGNYQVRITNLAGSVLSDKVSVTVLEEVPPTVDALGDMTAEVGQSVSYYTWISSHTSYTIQWCKDGSPISGETNRSLYLNNLKLTDAGLYTIVATNKAGSTTSKPSRLTVNPARPPVISSQPRNLSIWEGDTGRFSVSCTGSSPMTFTWYKDGVAIPGATSSEYYWYSSKRSDSGVYTVVVSNVAGSVTSDPATLEIIPPPVATISLTRQVTTNLGDSFNLWASISPSSGVYTYQWYLNGKPIAGATSNSYSVSVTSAAQLGDYLLTVTNSRGGMSSANCSVSMRSNTAPVSGAWVGTARVGDLAFFAYANPARLEIYDLQTETWRSSVPLDSAPTALCEGAGKLYYVSLGSLYSLAPSSMSSTLLSSTLGSRTTGLCYLNGKLIVYQNDGSYSGTRLLVVDAATAALVPQQPNVSTSYVSPTFAAYPAGNRVYTSSNAYNPTVNAITFDANGNYVSFTQSTDYTNNNLGQRVFISGDGALVFSEGGPVFATSTLTSTTNLLPFRDLGFRADGTPVTLTYSELRLHDQLLRNIGNIALAAPANALFLRGEKAYAFSYPTSGAQALVQIRKLEADADTGIQLTDPEGIAFTPDFVGLDASGTVLLLSRLKQQVFRWDPAARKFADKHFPLHGAPQLVTHSPNLNRLFLSYGQGLVRQVNLDQPGTSDSFFTQANNQVNGLAAAGQFVLINDPANSWSANSLFDANGKRLVRKDWADAAQDYLWIPSNNRLYLLPYARSWMEIRTDGSFGTTRNNSGYGSDIRKAWASPDGSSLLTNIGTFMDSDTGTENNHLSISSIIDATWMNKRLYTVRETWEGSQLERWGGGNYGKDASALIEGRPIRLLPLPSGRLLLVMMRGPRLFFAQFDEALGTVSIDGTGTASSISNLSARSEAGINDNTLTPSFVIEGTQPKRIIIRAVGPTLKDFGLGNPIPDPLINVFNNKQVAIAGNDNWGSVTNLTDLTGTSARLGAFALKAGSKDAAILLTLDPGAYTVQVTDSKNTVAPAMAEVYDADEGTGSSRLSNMALRGKVGSGDSTMIVGFVVSGSSPRTLLIRGIGPGLAKFGVSGTLSDPYLKLFAQGNDTPLYSNDNWSPSPVIAEAARKVGAFALDDLSRDASLLVTLDPGVYTVHLVSADKTTGVGLLELYLMPE